MVWRVCGGGDWFVDAIAIKEKSTLYKVSRFLSALIRLMSQSLRRTLLYGLRSYMFSASRPSILLWI